MQITYERSTSYPVGAGRVTLGGSTHWHTTTSTTSTSTTSTTSSINTDSTLSLTKQLVTHFVEDTFRKRCVRDRDQEEAIKAKLKVLVYSILLSHRKDHVRERSCLRLSELEEVIWHTHTLRQQRRFDDANSLDTCLHLLREAGHLQAGSDVRTVMRFLVALKGQGGPEGEVQQPTLAQLRPRIVQKENSPCFLPPGPLQYGDTFLQKAEHGRPYPSFPSSLYTGLPLSLPQGRGGAAGRSNPFDVEEMMQLSGAPPGTGVSPLLTGERLAVLGKGKVLGALLQGSREVTPDMTLSLPRLPDNAQGYTPFSLSLPTTVTKTQPASPSKTAAAGGDEGYASSNSTGSHSSGEEEDPWEAVLAALPLPDRRSWATLGHIPETKEKPFISEAGTETAHNMWALYHELWAILGGHAMPRVCVRPMKELCRDVLYLLIGVPSRSFPWSEVDESFSIKEGLCHASITPEALRGSLLPLVECGTLVRRLEMQYPTPKSDMQEVLTQGSVFTAFTFAIASVLQVHREMVLSLGEETLLSALQDKAQPLVKKIKFIASLCKISTSKKTKSVAPRTSSKRQVLGGVEEEWPGLPRGLCLLGELLNRMITTKDQDCLLLLVSIFRSACIPFFSYLEEWIYHGVCSDPGVEFMIEVNGAALLRRDRTYWTAGYTLRSPASVPAMLRDVLEEAFVCGKTLNLLRLCSRKHYLVAGGSGQPRMQLCVSGEELTHTKQLCDVYAANMDLLMAQQQVTVQQKAEEERSQKQKLLAISSNKHAAVLREIESKMQERNQYIRQQKAVRLQELKDEMVKAEKRKQEEKEREAQEDWNIAQEQQEMEKRKIQQEEALRVEVQQYYQHKIKEAERAEAIARWRVQRCSLSAARKHHLHTTTWPPIPAQAAPTDTQTPDLLSPQTPDSLPETPEQGQVVEGALRRPHNMNTRPDPGQRAKGCAFAPYHLHTERNEDLLKESPNQEVSSVSDMTTSMMSTSSDFVDTPFDENLPEFEADPKIQTIPESCVVENTNYAYLSSIDTALNDNGNGNMNLHRTTTMEITHTPPILLTESPDANANISEPIAILETRNDTQTRATEDTAARNLNELVLQFKERRAQAAAIKEKVLNEYHQTTATRNNINILRSRSVSSAAIRNKQRVLETEYGITEEPQEVGGRVLYSRQVSSTSTCSLRSWSSSERPSSSNAFTTPEEERPVLIDQEPTPPASPCTPQQEVTPIRDMVEAALQTLTTRPEATCYDLEYMKLMDQEPLLDITGTALRGKPTTRPAATTTSTTTSTTTTTATPSTLELSCVPIYFIRSIRMHLSMQSRLVNESLLAEVLVEGSLLEHFSALRSLLLLHDAHFAHALTSNLFGKLEDAACPTSLLVPSKLNHILYKSVADSCWSTSPQADNLSFAVTTIPPAFTHTTSVVDCLELRYRVSWPHNLVLDDLTLASYSRVWCFLASLHHAVWASNNLFCHISSLSRQDKDGRLARSPQFHQLCLHRHKMHHFLLSLQAYVISQIHQISWSKLEGKLRAKVTSLDHLYSLHASFIEAIISRCFLSQNGQVVHQVIKEVFSSTLQFCSQFLSHPWAAEEGGGPVLVHPAFSALKDTFLEFESRSAFLHKLLVKVGQRVLTSSHQQQLLALLDFNGYYARTNPASLSLSSHRC